MSYTNNHTNSSVVNVVNHCERSTPVPMKLETDDGEMSSIAKFAETHCESDSDDDDMDIFWDSITKPVVKYVENKKESNAPSELSKLVTVIESLYTKMSSVKKHIELINQREALLFQSSKTSRKRRRRKSVVKSEPPLKK